jgi:hypothetical protein
MTRDDQNSIAEDIAYLRGRFDTVIPELQETNRKITAMMGTHETRIRDTEIKQESMKATVVTIASVAGFAVTLFVNFLIRKI